MTDATLRELLTDLGSNDLARAAFDSDPLGYLRAQGHDLPDELVGEAIGHVAAGLPAETAEHLSTFTIADSPIPSLDDTDGEAIDALDGLRLLATAPTSAPESDEAVDQQTFEAEPDDVDAGFGSGAAAQQGSVVDDLDPDVLVVDSGDGVDGELARSIDPGDGLDELDPTGLDAPVADLDVEVELTVEQPVEADDPADLDGIE